MKSSLYLFVWLAYGLLRCFFNGFTAFFFHVKIQFFRAFMHFVRFNLLFCMCLREGGSFVET